MTLIYYLYIDIWYQKTWQIMEKGILNYSPTVMICGTPCMYSIRAGNFLCHQWLNDRLKYFNFKKKYKNIKNFLLSILEVLSQKSFIIFQNWKGNILESRLFRDYHVIPITLKLEQFAAFAHIMLLHRIFRRAGITRVFQIFFCNFILKIIV